jgi:antitoxin (DNA-binding transcriptional repressor) of toxin-antitoxin stability system
MKTVALEKSDLSTCVEQAQRGRVVVTRNRKPVALIVGVEGLDREQLELGSSDKFWRLIEERRNQKTITRGALERRLRRSSRVKRS